MALEKLKEYLGVKKEAIKIVSEVKNDGVVELKKEDKENKDEEKKQL